MPKSHRSRRDLLLSMLALVLALTLVQCKGKQGKGNLQGSTPPKIDLSEALLQFEPAIQRFEQMEADSPSGTGGIVFTGSSSIRKWETLQEDMAPLTVVNRGFGGSIIRQVSYYADRMLLPLKPRLIVFYCGENDICNEVTSHEEPLQNFKDFTAIIHHYLPDTRILFLSMKPSPLRWQYWEKYEKGNRLIENHAQKEPLLDYLDISATMMKEDGTPRPEIWVSDSLHMNALGYEGWTSTVKPEVARIWKEINETVPEPGNRKRGEPRIED